MTAPSGGVLRADAAADAPALELQHIVKEFPGQPPVRALDDVSLRVDEGEMVAVVGPSGSGKSTLLHIMGTLDRPSSGRVLVDGVDTSILSDAELSALRGRSIGFVFQSFFLLPGMTALENVANGLMYSGVAVGERRRLAGDALERVGLGHRLGHAPSELSGGESQRVAIARAIIHRPTLLLADEPTGNLDAGNGEHVLNLMLELNREMRTSLVIVTHDHSIANRMDRVLVLEDGRLVERS